MCVRCAGGSSTLRWGEGMVSLPPTDWPMLSVSGEEEEEEEEVEEVEERRMLRW